MIVSDEDGNVICVMLQLKPAEALVVRDALREYGRVVTNPEKKAIAKRISDGMVIRNE